jgi:hypothetical protein
LFGLNLVHTVFQQEVLVFQTHHIQQMVPTFKIFWLMELCFYTKVCQIKIAQVLLRLNMKALVSPQEKRTDYEGNVGDRIAQVEQNEFPVAAPLFWTDCPNDCVADIWWYYNGACEVMPQPPQPEPEPTPEA